MRHTWPNGLQPPLLRTIAELRIVFERASLQFGDVGGKLGNLSEGVVDRHLRKAGTALSRRARESVKWLQLDTTKGDSGVCALEQLLQLGNLQLLHHTTSWKRVLLPEEDCVTRFPVP